VTLVRAADALPAALPGVAALLKAVFPRAPRLDTEWLSWGYLGNPLGPSLSCTALAEDRVVAHVGGRWLRARLAAGAPPARGVLIHHAATDAAFRGRGLLVELIEAALSRAAAVGAEFAVAVLNANSFHAFVRRAGFTALGPLSVRVGVGPLPLRDPAAPRPDFEPVREPAWLAWRLAAPGSPYRARRRSTGFELWADSGSFGIPVLVGEEADAAAGERLQPFAARSPLRSFVGLDAARRFRGTAYVELPLRLRPSPLQLVFRPLAPAVVSPDPARVRFEALDFDAW
jgi:GNAT superfamily N-acetyltransferase